MKITSKIILLGAVALAAFTVGASAVPITIVNGGFEESPFGAPFETFQTGANIGGWTVAQGSIDGINGYWENAEGSKSIDLAGQTRGAISQEIFVPVSGKVDVAFALAGNPDDSNKLKTLEISLLSTGAQTFTFLASSDKANMGWTDVVASFTGISAGMYTLQFRDVTLGGTGQFGAALDNVRVATPDGGMTASLLGLAMAGVGLVRRKFAV